jgi:hypothetical protein
MIIFDLDGTLSDCEHRRHLVDRMKAFHMNIDMDDWKPDWNAFYKACDKDMPIEPVIEIIDGIYFNSSSHEKFFSNVEIWSGRSESVRQKTLMWLDENLLFDKLGAKIKLKMRPIGNHTPDDELKEKWLDETLAQGKKVEYVFDDRPKVIRMWRRRGIFVFDCNQTGEEF